MKRMYLYNRINNAETCAYVPTPVYQELIHGGSLSQISQHLNPVQFNNILHRLEADASELDSIEATVRHHTLQEYGRG